MDPIYIVAQVLFLLLSPPPLPDHPFQVMTTSNEELLPYLPPPSVLVHQRWKPDVEHAPSCPRCDSSNTKFCYYNNYSLSQPRYFCKGCRRCWTKGGSLRNVPVGGGCRRNRRPRSAKNSAVARAPTAAGACHLQPTPLRPDLAYDDSSPAVGSNIDLALLYSRFLNHRSVDSSPEVSLDLDQSSALRTAGDSGDHPQLRPALINPDLQKLPGGMVPEINGYPSSSVGDFGFCLGSTCYAAQMMLPAPGRLAGNDLFWPAASTSSAGFPLPWQYCSPQGRGVEALQEDEMQLHASLLANTWDAFGLPSYGVPDQL